VRVRSARRTLVPRAATLSRSPSERSAANRVCREDQPEARLVELGRALDDTRLNAGELECDRRPEPAYPGSNAHRPHPRGAAVA
jgi:hypothetical protein